MNVEIRGQNDVFAFILGQDLSLSLWTWNPCSAILASPFAPQMPCFTPIAEITEGLPHPLALLL